MNKAAVERREGEEACVEEDCCNLRARPDKREVSRTARFLETGIRPNKGRCRPKPVAQDTGHGVLIFPATANAAITRGSSLHVCLTLILVTAQ